MFGNSLQITYLFGHLGSIRFYSKVAHFGRPEFLLAFYGFKGRFLLAGISVEVFLLVILGMVRIPHYGLIIGFHRVCYAIFSLLRSYQLLVSLGIP